MTAIGIVIIVLLVFLNINVARLNNNVIDIAKVYARYVDRKDSR